MAKIKLLIVDDEPLIRSALSFLLDAKDNIEVVAEAANGQEAYDQAQTLRPDCVLMDIRMPDCNGIEGARLIHEALPEIKILMLTTFQDNEYIAQALAAGASGYLLKNSDHEEIAKAIEMVMEGHMIFDGQLSEQISQQYAKTGQATFDPAAYDLTPRELSILELIASGLSNQEIADQLHLSLGTVKNNISTILQKLNLRDRTQLAIFAFEQGIR